MGKKKELMKKLEARILEIRDYVIADEGITVMNTARIVEPDNVELQWYDKDWNSHCISFWDDGEGWYNVARNGMSLEMKEWKSQEEFEVWWDLKTRLEKGYAAIAADPDYQKETEKRLARRRKPASWEDDDIDNIGYHYD